MKCPVCDKENQSMLCPSCGFDCSRDYERYPTFGPLWIQSASGLRRQWQERGRPDLPVEPYRTISKESVEPLRQELPSEPRVREMKSTAKTGPNRKQRDCLLLIAATLFVMVFALSILLVAKILNSETNILRRDIFYSNGNVVGYRCDQIVSVTFLDTLRDAPEDAWDVSEAGNGTVLAWVEPRGARYDLYIGADGGVRAGESCAMMFVGYVNVERIVFDDAFDTSNVRDMSRMFYDCHNLKSLDLSGFDTSNVQNMSSMFGFCNDLSQLTLGEGFVTTNANTAAMFHQCPAGNYYKHLLH